MRRIVILPDVHLDLEAPRPYLVARRFIEEYKPDEIILLGDFLDCQSLSHWNESKRLKMEGRRFKLEMYAANKELDILSKHTSKIVYCIGNHEDWCNQYVESHPEMEGLIELEGQLRLKERNIKAIPLNQLYGVGERGKVYFTHGLYVNEFHAKKHLSRLGCNIVYGHTHNYQTYQLNQKMQEPYCAWGLGCLCDHEPEYLRGKPANWLNQFAICEVTDRMFSVTPINIIDNKCIYNGKIYQ